MTTQTAFDKYQIKVNKNLSTGSVAIDRGRFVLLFNEASNKLIEYILDKKNEDDIRYIQKILVTDYSLNISEYNREYYKFNLPKDYFDFSNASAIASKQSCKNKKIFLFEVKDDDKNEFLQDEFNKPSFEARESLFNITSDTIKVYVDDFEIEKLNISYYRYPTQIKLLNEEDPESDFDNNFNPEFDDKFVDRILSIATGEFQLNIENSKFQADKARAIQKI